MDAKDPSQIDRNVSHRLRARRKELNLSQEAVAARLGVTFQQVQKYERGVNRISAGRLFQLAQVLETTIPYFYEGSDVIAAAMSGVSEEAADFLGPIQGDAVDLVVAFQQISEPDLRQSILATAKAAAMKGGRARPS